MGAKTALYLLASGLDDESEDKKIAVLLHCIGEDALEIYNTLDILYEDAEDKEMEEVITFLKITVHRNETLCLKDTSSGHISLMNTQALIRLSRN